MVGMSDQSNDYTITVPFAPDGYADVVEAAEAAQMTVEEWVHIAALNWALRARMAKDRIAETLANGETFNYLGLPTSLYGVPPDDAVSIAPTE
jgi:hypothetical protein